MAPETVAIEQHDIDVAGAESGVPDRIPLEVLERNLTSHAAHIAAAEADAARDRCRLTVEYGPPIPADLAHDRKMQAHWARSAALADLYRQSTSVGW